MITPDRSRPILMLEAATAAGSVALFLPAGADGDGAGVHLASHREVEVTMGAGTADALFPAITSLLELCGVRPSSLGAVVCGSGPGSFTSLRIAAALAKGLAHGVGCPLFAVPSLALAAASLGADVPSGRYVVHADALRGERYVLDVERLADGSVEVIGTPGRRTVDELLTTTYADRRIVVGAAPESLPSAHAAVPHARALWAVRGEWRQAPVDVARWEPAYGRLAEAQVKWEAAHGRALDSESSA